GAVHADLPGLAAHAVAEVLHAVSADAGLVDLAVHALARPLLDAERVADLAGAAGHGARVDLRARAAAAELAGRAGLSHAWAGREPARPALAVHTGPVRAAGHALARALQRNALLRADVAGRTCRSRVAVLDANVGVATILEACLVGFAGSAARVGAAEERVG